MAAMTNKRVFEMADRQYKLQDTTYSIEGGTGYDMYSAERKLSNVYTMSRGVVSSFKTRGTAQCLRT